MSETRYLCCMPYKDPEKRKQYHAAYSKEWDKRNKDKRRKATRESMQRWRDKNPELSAEKMRDWRKNNREKSLAVVSNYKKKNPEKANAHRLVLLTVKSGELVKLPCEICGNTKSQAHHENYDQPLSVKWLCQKHHSEVHKLMR